MTAKQRSLERFVDERLKKSVSSSFAVEGLPLRVCPGRSGSFRSADLNGHWNGVISESWERWRTRWGHYGARKAVPLHVGGK